VQVDRRVLERGLSGRFEKRFRKIGLTLIFEMSLAKLGLRIGQFVSNVNYGGGGGSRMP
jgi:hypothetical protein